MARLIYFTEQQLNLNYLEFVKHMEKYVPDSGKLLEHLGDKIKVAPYTGKTDYGGAYPGALVYTSLKLVSVVGFLINNSIFKGSDASRYRFPLMAVNPQKLMKVLLLSNIGRCDMFKEVDDDWNGRRRDVYEFNPENNGFRVWENTLHYCQYYGIRLERDEIEAIKGFDTIGDGSDRFLSPMAVILKSASLITDSILQTMEKKRKEESEKQ